MPSSHPSSGSGSSSCIFGVPSVPSSRRPTFLLPVGGPLLAVYIVPDPLEHRAEMFGFLPPSFLAPQRCGHQDSFPLLAVLSFPPSPSSIFLPFPYIVFIHPAHSWWPSSKRFFDSTAILLAPSVLTRLFSPCWGFFEGGCKHGQSPEQSPFFFFSVA